MGRKGQNDGAEQGTGKSTDSNGKWQDQHLESDASDVGKDLSLQAQIQTYENQQDLKHYAPETMHWFDNQLHWYHYLTGVLTDETRYDTPLIGLNTSLLAEGIVLSTIERAIDKYYVAFNLVNLNALL